MCLRWLTVVVHLIFLEKLLCQVVLGWGVKSPFQLQPKFLYQIKGETLIVWLQDVLPAVSASFWPLSRCTVNLLSIPGAEGTGSRSGMGSPSLCVYVMPLHLHHLWLPGLWLTRAKNGSCCLPSHVSVDLRVLHMSRLSFCQPRSSKKQPVSSPGASVCLRAVLGVSLASLVCEDDPLSLYFYAFIRWDFKKRSFRGNSD